MDNMKERILRTALRLFAANGYEAVSVSDIAGELGVTKGALYRHYRNKHDILDSIVRRMEQQDAEKSNDHALPGEALTEDSPPDTLESYQSVSSGNIIAFSKEMFRYWTEDEYASLFRKMLTLEQFRSREMGMLYQQYLVSGPVGYVTDLFTSLGIPDPEKKAAEYYAPMFLLYSMYDGAVDKAAITALADDLLDDFPENASRQKAESGKGQKRK
ncbi:MAG: TetR/AcrR family transcriptional regulator [Lachnospiraceae bacterium]|nr:TetR/AcrR family transcriptional regulator [Lachnospiraceae bacterium]